jgi:hypothetical protein
MTPPDYGACMKNSVKLALAGLFAAITGLAAMPSFADCNPPCRNGKVCRYDSTHNPPFFCRRPPTAQSAPVTARNAGPGALQVANPQTAKSANLGDTATHEVGHRGVKSQRPRNNAAAQYNPKELGVDRARAGNCFREGGVNDTTHKRSAGSAAC